MKTLAVLLGLTLLLVVVQARHYSDRSESLKHADDESTDNFENERENRGGQLRHRRKRWQMNYGYDYPPPPFNPYYLEPRDRNQDVMPQIWRLLDEISAYVKRPPPPPVLPQTIYVPYPVPYPVPQNCTCNVNVVNVTAEKRFPILQDANQNWGIVENTNGADYEDDGSDGARPISFDPVTPQSTMNRPQPSIEHGSEQATNVQEERAPETSEVPNRTKMCNAAILNCCFQKTNQLKRACFTKQGCVMTYAKGEGCSNPSISAAIKSFGDLYSPQNQ